VCSSVNLKSHLAIPFNQSYVRSYLATSFNQNQKNIKSGLIVTGDLLRWKNVKNDLIMMSDLPKWKMENFWSGLIVMGDLPKWKMMTWLWWVNFPNGRWWSYYDGWPTQMEKYDLPGKKTWQAKSWQDKADKRRFLIAGLTWRLLLMTRLISLFLWDSPTSTVHPILFSFQDLNWFFVIINSMILSLSTILLDFIEDLWLVLKSAFLSRFYIIILHLKYQ